MLLMKNLKPLHASSLHCGRSKTGDNAKEQTVSGESWLARVGHEIVRRIIVVHEHHEILTNAMLAIVTVYIPQQELYSFNLYHL